MNIELHCEKCGKLIKVSSKQAGKSGKCPYCDSDVYIPTPEREIEELPLEPEDVAERQREIAMQKERLQLERILSKEDAIPGGASPMKAGPAGEPKTVSIKEIVLTYLVAMRDTNLTRADQALAILLKHKDAARKVVDQLVADQIPPQVMAGVPAGVYQGFLKKLRSQL
ncbi:MAG: hypothetical protein ACYTF1_06085 [Planctomycetota bacterium]|jgi:phage FluMu protein Com